MATTLRDAVLPGAQPKDEPKAPASPFQDFRTRVKHPQFVAGLRLMLGSDEAVSMFISVVLTAVQDNPSLLFADRRSLILACMKAARAKMMPDGKEAVFNIYRTKVKGERGDEWIDAVQFLPMAEGMIKKLWDSELVTYVDAAAVYQRDEFSFERGDTPRLFHKPTLEAAPGDIVAAYLVVKLKNGETKREVMPRRDIDKVRASSKAPDGLMWKTFFDQGAIKSVIKRAYKQLPRAPEFERVIEADNEAMGLAIGDRLDSADPFGDAATMAKPVTGEASTGSAEAKKPEALEHQEQVKVPPIVGQNPAEVQPELVEAGPRQEPAEAKAEEAEFLSFAHVADLLEKAKTREEFDAACAMIERVGGARYKSYRRELADKASKLLIEKFAAEG